MSDDYHRYEYDGGLDEVGASCCCCFSSAGGGGGGGDQEGSSLMWCYKNNNDDNDQGKNYLEEVHVRRAKKRILKDFHPLYETPAEKAFPYYLWAISPLIWFIRRFSENAQSKEEKSPLIKSMARR